jgi:hypothetical protein
LTIYPFTFSFFDNLLTVTLGGLADLSSSEGFSVCDTLGWSYDIMMVTLGFSVSTYGWTDSIYDTLFNSDDTSDTYVEDPSVGAVTDNMVEEFASRSLISRSGWFGFNNCDDSVASYPW